MTEDRPCKYCHQPFTPKNDSHKFCDPKCKAAWHREAPYKNGISVKLGVSRTNKSGIHASIAVDIDDREKFAKLNLPGTRLFLVAIQEDAF